MYHWRRPGIPTIDFPPFLELFYEDSILVHSPAGQDNHLSRAFEDARNHLLLALHETVQRGCYARSQTLLSAPNELLDTIVCEVLGPPKSRALELCIYASLSICEWRYQLDARRKSFKSAMVRWIWSNRNSSTLREDVTGLIEKANFVASNVMTSDFGYLLVGILTLPQHQPRSLGDVICFIQMSLCSKLGAAILQRSHDTEAVQSMSEHLLLATERSQDQFTDIDTRRLGSIYAVEVSSTSSEHLTTLRRAWINLCGMYLLICNPS